MKKFIISVAVLAYLFCTGCTNRVDAYQINLAQKVCSEHGGVNFMNPVSKHVQCFDGYFSSIYEKP